MRQIAVPPADPEAVPSELRQLPQWICWRYAQGKKLPISSKTGKPVSVTDPSAWTSFQEAFDHARARRGWGIGFVFSAADPYCGIDLDDCRSQDTGVIKVEAWQVLEALGSYSEVSPSGCGVKIICRAKLPRGYKNESIELYDNKRFFTITGDVVQGLPSEIADAQSAVDALVAEHFPSQGVGGDPLPDKIPVGSLHNVLVSLAGTLRRRGLGLEEIDAALQAVNRERAEKPGTVAEVRKIAESVCSLYPAGALDDLVSRDYGHASVLSTLFHDRYRWCVQHKTWMGYSGGVWRPVPEERVAKEAADALRQRYSLELAKATDKGVVLDLSKRVAETCTFARIQGALAFLRGWDGILTRVEEFDKSSWLLNVKNGTLNLETFVLQPHTPDNLFTKQAPVEYDPSARSKRWEEHLRLCLPDPDIRRQVQRDLGLALVGADLEELLPIWWGDGRGGKSTTLRVLCEVLGDYAGMAAPRLLLASKHERHSVELADLRGLRLVFSSETGQGSQLDEEKAKLLTGGERIKARRLYENPVEFPKTWTIVLICNHKPVIRGRDWGIWRRVRLIPWTVRIPTNRRRPQEIVVQELVEDGSAILTWLVEGLRDWQGSPHWVAAAVVAATEAYREESDPLAEFIEECCTLKPSATVPQSELYTLYTEWCTQTGEQPVSKKGFTQLLHPRGITIVRQGHSNVRTYQGITICDRMRPLSP